NHDSTPGSIDNPSIAAVIDNPSFIVLVTNPAFEATWGEAARCATEMLEQSQVGGQNAAGLNKGLGQDAAGLNKAADLNKG
ncbi:hypothetical protein NVV43_29635, partial [Escherichia marmotae]|nr:hypothetical protein [Escherichia marmotae]